MRKLIFTLILLLTGYIGYMYFFGQGEDKSNAQTIVKEAGEVAKSIGHFLGHQKYKYDNGEFDQLIKRVRTSIAQLKPGADQPGETQDRLRDILLELKKIDPEKLNEENRQKLRQTLTELEEALK